MTKTNIAGLVGVLSSAIAATSVSSLTDLFNQESSLFQHEGSPDETRANDPEGYIAKQATLSAINDIGAVKFGADWQAHAKTVYGSSPEQQEAAVGSQDDNSAMAQLMAILGDKSYYDDAFGSNDDTGENERA